SINHLIMVSGWWGKGAPSTIKSVYPQIEGVEEVTDLIITTAHLRSVPGLTSRPGYCVSGARAWFNAHGLDWHRFVAEGMPASVLEATGDELALRLVSHARAEASNGRP
ncbi:hypothetical protein, partial [Pseudomonas aeruginosa]|uniref:hypothetical protein n=1 Tax=Pseudomonas aeruginosa TaxID=287 RepID=UPI003CC55F49